MNKSEQINELATSLAKAQSEMRPAEFDKVNPHFKTKYSSLNAIWEACRLPLSKHGLSVIQMVDCVGEQLVLVTTLAHSSGQFITSLIPMVGSKEKPQTIGSLLTYYRRYSLSSMVGITSDEDDDGNQAQENCLNKKPDPAKPTPAQIKEIQSVVAQCSPEFIKWISEQMQQMNTSFENMPLEWFNSLKDTATKNMLEHQKVKKAEDVK